MYGTMRRRYSGGRFVFTIDQAIEEINVEEQSPLDCDNDEVADEENLPIPDNDEVDMVKFEMFQMMKPLLTWMQICGVFFKYVPEERSARTYHLRKYSRYWQAYALSVLFMDYSGLIITSTLFVIYGNTDFTSILLEVSFSMMALMCALGSTICYRVNATGCYFYFCKQFSKLKYHNLHTDGMKNYIIKIQIFFGFLSVAVVTTVTYGLASIIYAGNFETTLFGYMMEPFQKKLPHEVYIVAYYFIGPCAMYVANILVLQATGVAVLCLTVQYAFQCLNERTKRTFKEIDGKSDVIIRAQVEKLHRAYSDVKKLMNIIDDGCGYVFLMGTSLTLTHLCVQTYTALYFCADPHTKTVLATWALSELACLLIMLLCPAEVHTQALMSQRTLYGFQRLPKFSKTFAVITTFSDLITSDKTSITAVGVFEITREFVLSLGATFLTYLGYLTKNRPPDDFCRFQRERTTTS